MNDGATATPAVCVGPGCCLITSCVASTNVAVALITRFGTPALLTVTFCAPAAQPSVQLNVASPAASVATEATESEPLPAVTAIVSGTADMACPSVAIARTVTEMVEPPGTDCPWPATAVSEARRGKMRTMPVSAWPESVCATTRAKTRGVRVRPLPALGAVIVARVGSSERKAIGVPLNTDPLAARATAVKVKGSPTIAVTVSGEIASIAAFAPMPT